jgi:hypothetical protein
MARKTRLFFLTIFLSFFILTLFAQKVTYRGNWGPAGYSLVQGTSGGVTVNFSVNEFEMMEMDLDGAPHQKVLLPGHFLPNQEGAPDLPGSSRYILVPEGAVPEMHVLGARTVTLQDLDIMPAGPIPTDTDNDPIQYTKDSAIYHRNAYYPESPVIMETGLKIRGMQVVLLGVMPFQYNPVTKELKVYQDIEVRIDFTGGPGIFGIERYRSRQWDAILNNHILNSSSLPYIDYSQRGTNAGRTVGCEYLIISPDGTDFQQWADTIKRFRTEQGILTEVKTLTEVGGNTESAIEAYIDNAYNTWDIPPSAVLLLGDHGSDASNSITSVVLNDHPGASYNPYVSDNIYADVDGDQLPDIAFARITARNAAELELMIHKFMDYETSPPTSPDFYDHPITALGWQTERWFQICSETVGGYLKNVHGKNPVRINEVYEGDPDVDPWSTWGTTATVLDYFGPDGQGYIPATPGELGGWTGGTATDINNAINSGSFLLQHRDHGAYWGWGEPYYTTSSISGLTNTDLTFVMSINCQTGQFNNPTETFTERFHRYSDGGTASGALGLIAATQVSYSFVNDVFIWGLYDYMWPDFMPTFSSNPVPGGLLPCFGNVAGKYHLQASTWTGLSNTYKIITYKLFHHHGDAYLTLFSEVPQPLTVSHDTFILPSETSFTVQADSGAFIALTSNGMILGTALSDGDPISVPVSGTLIPGDEMIVTITMTNYYRYRSAVDIDAPAGPYVTYCESEVGDAAGNNNGQLDCGEDTYLTVSLENIGGAQADNITAILRTSDPMIQVTDSTATYGNIPSGDTTAVVDAFHIIASDSLPDGHLVSFEVIASDGSTNWTDHFSLTGHAPVTSMLSHELNDSGGNGNGLFDAGETVDLRLYVNNSGTTEANGCMVSLSTSDPYILITDPVLLFGDINPGDTADQPFEVTADPLIPPLQAVTF